MELFESKHFVALIGGLALFFSGCSSTGSKQIARQFEVPQTITSKPDKILYSKALKAQNEEEFESAIKLWKVFLSKHPDSFEGHNNLGLVYYAQDMLSQALQEFETAYRLKPVDPKIRKNLVQALQLKASMLRESREYSKTLEVLTRLEQVVEPDKKQKILFKKKQVEDQIFLEVTKADKPAAYRDFINRFPDGLNAVRAREYLNKYPNKISKSTSQGKNQISSDKAIANPNSDSTSRISSEKLNKHDSSSSTTTHTPPPEETKKKKVAKAPDGGKESLGVAGESNPIRGKPDAGAAVLDTPPDLKSSSASALPVKTNAFQSANTVTGDTKMQPDKQKPAEAATASAGANINQETESAAPKSVKPESDKIARIAKKELSKTESTKPEQTQPEPAQKMKTKPQVNPKENPTEVASVNPGVQDVKQAKVPSESSPVEKTLAETVNSSTAMVVVQIKADWALNVRTKPSMQGKILGYLENGDMMPFMGKSGNWYQIKIEEDLFGWVSKKYSTIRSAAVPMPPVTATAKAVTSELPSLQPGQQQSAETVNPSTAMVVVRIKAGSTLNVRAKPSMRGEILGYLENGDMMPFMSESRDWYQIEIEEDLSGWVSQKFSGKRNVN